MKKKHRFPLLIFRLICGFILIAYLLYFLLGDKLAIRFSVQEYNKIFIQVLVFAASAALYAFFILSIKSIRKRWKNILLFIGAVVIGSFPLLFYHGFLMYQCGFWNSVETEVKTIFVNSENPDEKVKIVEIKCEPEDNFRTDTIYVKKINGLLEWTDNAVIKKSQSGKFVTP